MSEKKLQMLNEFHTLAAPVFVLLWDEAYTFAHVTPQREKTEY